VGMYLRETRRTNRDGSVVRYLQLAHNERHPETGVSTAKVIHNFGRTENVDRAALARLVSSISRFLDPAQAVAAAAGAEVDVLDSRRLGGVFVLDRLWERLGGWCRTGVMWGRCCEWGSLSATPTPVRACGFGFRQRDVGHWRR
jgi:hypothetical protein